MGLAGIARRVRRCTLCPLSRTRTCAVPGEGPASAAVFLVGEAPGRDEDASGLPFVGRAGRVLDVALGKAGVPRGGVFVTNVIKCRPPGNRRPKPAEVDACADYLDHQIALVRPRIVVALGQTALDRLAPGKRLADWRGKVVEDLALPVVVTYHPAAALYNPRLTATLARDLRKAARLAKRPPPPPGEPPRPGRPWDVWRSAGAVVFRRDRALLIRLIAEDRWCLPKGTLEGRETPAQAAVREIREETGLEVRLGPLLTKQRYEHYRPKDGNNYRKTVTYFTAIRKGGRLELEDEFDAARWCTRAEGLALLRYAGEKALWRRAFAQRKKAFTRS